MFCRYGSLVDLFTLRLQIKPEYLLELTNFAFLLLTYVVIKLMNTKIRLSIPLRSDDCSYLTKGLHTLLRCPEYLNPPQPPKVTPSFFVLVVLHIFSPFSLLMYFSVLPLCVLIMWYILVVDGMMPPRCGIATRGLRRPLRKQSALSSAKKIENGKYAVIILCTVAHRFILCKAMANLELMGNFAV